jgi:hypothetical protein
MNHQEAKQSRAVERYLLGEMTPAERDEFEAHFFECTECAAELKAAGAFLEAAKTEFRRGGFPQAAPPRAPVPRMRRRFPALWRPAVISPAFACLLLVLAYQGLIVVPRLRGELTESRQSEILVPVALLGGNSRAGGELAVRARDAESLLLTFDVPAVERRSGYSAVLVAPSGTQVFTMPISVEQAKDTVSIRVPSRHWEVGEYTLTVAAAPGAGTGAPVVASWHFRLNTAL